jgi:hypothetical protein
MSAAWIQHHRHQFGGGALGVGQVLLADALADGDHDALPADHRAQAERQRHRDLHPWRNELRRLRAEAAP